jgi:4-amino-4-deoxy-L-arabinose transferase-like glycosyltransferase
LNYLASKKVLISLGLVALLKLALLILLPLTGDEAYFIYWAQELKLGYYDHPPAVGWLIALLGLLSDNLLLYRSFTYLSSIFIAWIIYRWLKDDGVDRSKASLVALLFWLSPASLAFILTTNDTVLLLNTVLGLFLLSRTIKYSSYFYALGAGLFLGLAFLSKYFAGFVFIGLFVFLIRYWRSVPLSKALVIIALIACAIGTNFYYNYTNCWNNILFNFFSRTENSQFAISNLFSFIGFFILLMSPWGIYNFFRSREESSKSFSMTSFTLIGLYASIPLIIVIALVSLTNPIGFHWLIVSTTLLYGVFSLLSKNTLKRVVTYNLLFAISIYLGSIGVLTMGKDMLVNQKENVAAYLAPERICEQLPLGVIFTTGYSSQSMLSYHCNRDDIHVFGSKSKYGREDDKRVEFATLNHQNLIILGLKSNDFEKVAPFFESTYRHQLKPVMGKTFELIKGERFNYSEYKSRVIEPVIKKFYTPPKWLKELLPKAECKLPR